MITFNLVEVEAGIIATREAVAALIRYAETRTDLSPEGRRNAVHKALESEGIAAHVTALGALVTQIEAVPTRMIEEARAAALPVAGDDNARVAAELEVARRMARPGWADNQAAAIFALEPSPVRTILLEEAQAAGHVAEHVVETRLHLESDEVRDLKTRAGMLRANFAFLREQFDAAAGDNPHIRPYSLTATIPVSTPSAAHATVEEVEVNAPVIRPAALRAGITLAPVYRPHIKPEPNRAVANFDAYRA